MKKILVWTCVIVGVAFWSFVGGYTVKELERPEKPVELIANPPTQQDPDLVAKAAALDLDYSKINLIYGEFKDVDQSALFSYESDGVNVTYTITVKPGQDTNTINQALAHEYYHYIWQTRPDVNAHVTPYLDGMFAADSPMKERMKPYMDDKLVPYTPAFTDELFAIYCTEVATDSLVSPVAQQCKEFVNLGLITVDRSL